MEKPGKSAGKAQANSSPVDGLGILSNPNFSYVLIVLFFICYLITGEWVFGLLVGLCILWAVVLEFALGAKSHGMKNEIKETAIALALALLVWFGSGYLLQTSSPLNAIVSCSMLPHVQRGDMVVLSGDRLLAPEEEIASLPGATAVVYESGVKQQEVPGSLYSYCSQMQRQSTQLCKNFIFSPEKFAEKRGALTFGYEKCEIVFPKTGERQPGPCVAWLEVNGRKYYENLANDVVVYQPNKEEYYSRVGDIIHRAFIRLKIPDGTYFLTKGDNNPVFDIQVHDEGSNMGNSPVELSRSKGRILFAVPYIGYLKLFISPGAIATPAGCDRQFAKYS